MLIFYCIEGKSLHILKHILGDLSRFWLCTLILLLPKL